jgi:hypothetical protein
MLSLMLFYCQFNCTIVHFEEYDTQVIVWYDALKIIIKGKLYQRKKTVFEIYWPTPGILVTVGYWTFDVVQVDSGWKDKRLKKKKKMAKLPQFL